MPRPAAPIATVLVAPPCSTVLALAAATTTTPYIAQVVATDRVLFAVLGATLSPEIEHHQLFVQIRYAGTVAVTSVTDGRFGSVEWNETIGPLLLVHGQQIVFSVLDDVSHVLVGQSEPILLETLARNTSDVWSAALELRASSAGGSGEVVGNLRLMLHFASSLGQTQPKHCPSLAVRSYSPVIRRTQPHLDAYSVSRRSCSPLIMHVGGSATPPPPSSLPMPVAGCRPATPPLPPRAEARHSGGGMLPCASPTSRQGRVISQEHRAVSSLQQPLRSPQQRFCETTLSRGLPGPMRDAPPENTSAKIPSQASAEDSSKKSSLPTGSSRGQPSESERKRPSRDFGSDSGGSTQKPSASDSGGADTPRRRIGLASFRGRSKSPRPSVELRVCESSLCSAAREARLDRYDGDSLGAHLHVCDSLFRDYLRYASGAGSTIFPCLDVDTANLKWALDTYFLDSSKSAWLHGQDAILFWDNIITFGTHSFLVLTRKHVAHRFKVDGAAEHWHAPLSEIEGVESIDDELDGASHTPGLRQRLRLRGGRTVTLSAELGTSLQDFVTTLARRVRRLGTEAGVPRATWGIPLSAR